MVPFGPVSLILTFFILLLPPHILSQPSIGQGRSNQFNSETVLTPISVKNISQKWCANFTSKNSSNNNVYAQPLVIHNVNISGVSSILLILTELGYLNALDAITGTIIWSRAPLPTDQACPQTKLPGNCADELGAVSIMSTPVIDTSNIYFYFIGKACPTTGKHGGSTTYEHYLHKAYLANGTDESNVTISGTDPSKPNITWSSQLQNQRVSLSLYNGVIYFGFGSFCDITPYEGWIFAYDSATLIQKAVLCLSYVQAGIWMSGSPLAIDSSGNIYGVVGNGRDPHDAKGNYGECVIKLTPSFNPSFSLNITGFYDPPDDAILNAGDLDQGVAGIVMIPNTNLAVSGSKNGWMYLHDTTNLTTPIQNLTVSNTTNQIHSHLIYTTTGQTVQTGLCVWPQQDYLQCYNFNSSGKFDTTPYFTGSIRAPTSSGGGSPTPGGILSISSNNNIYGTHIIWASIPHSGTADQHKVYGDLYAFDPTGGLKAPPLWSNVSSNAYYFAQFNPLTIDSGRVYRPTFSGLVCCYG